MIFFDPFICVVSRSVSTENLFSEIKDGCEVDDSGSADDLDLATLLDAATISVQICKSKNLRFPFLLLHDDTVRRSQHYNHSQNTFALITAPWKQ